MIILKATNETLKLTTTSTADLDVTVFWADRTTTVFSPDSTLTKIVSATSTTILAAPAATTQRQFKGAKVRNVHASTTNTITLKLDVGGTVYVQTSDIPLLAGETLVIDTEGVWNVYTVSGTIKTTGVFTASRVMVTDSTGQPTVSSITTTILDYLSGLSSNAQTQINGKQATIAYTTENVANKATDFSTLNNTLYPSVQAVENRIIAQVAGLWDDRGNYDASVNTFPASGGSGTAGAILKGDIWTVSVIGTLGGTAVSLGDTVRAVIDTPGQTAGNWAIHEGNLGYTPENLANKNASGGYPGLSGFSLQIKNAANTFISLISNTNTGIRNYTLRDRDGVLIDDTDLATKQASDATLSALAGQNFAQDTVPVGTGTDTVTQLSFAASRTLVKKSTGNIIATAITDYVINTIYNVSDAIGLTVLINLASGTTIATLLKGLMSGADFQRARKEWDAYADFGIVFDLRRAEEITTVGTQQVIAASGTTVTIPNAGATTPFTSTAVDANKRITITGAGASGAMYVGTIVTVTNSTTCTVTPAAGTTVTATTSFPVTVQWGTDNTTAAAAMVTAINAQSYPTPKITFGKYNFDDWTGSAGFPARMVFNKTPWFEGTGGSHNTDVGDYTKTGGIRLAWWGSSSDGGTDFGAFITVSPTGTQSLKRPRFSSISLDGRNGDQNQALFLLKLASCHGAMLDDGVFFMDALGVALWTDIATSPTEAKDMTRFDFQRLCFRQLDNTPGASVATTTTTSTITLTQTPQTIAVPATAGFSSTGGYGLINTITGRRFIFKYTGITANTSLNSCTIALEDVVHTPTLYSGAMLCPCQPGVGSAMKLSGGSGANSSVGIIKGVQISQGDTWGQAAIDCGNSDSIIFEQIIINGGSNVTEANGNRQRRPGVQLNGSHVSPLATALTLASRNNVFRDIDPGGAPSGPKGGISVMGVLNTGALMLAPSCPNYVYGQQMGNGAPIPTVENGAYLSWTGNGMTDPGPAGSASIAAQVITVSTVTKITGSEARVPPQGWQLGTTYEWLIPLRKTSTAAGTALIFNVRQNATGTANAGGTVIATVNFTGTPVIDQGCLYIRLSCVTLGGAGTATATFAMDHNLLATGLSTGVTVPASAVTATSGKVRTNATMAAFDTTLPNNGPAFLFVEINPSTSTITIDAPVTVECKKPGNP